MNQTAESIRRRSFLVSLAAASGAVISSSAIAASESDTGCSNPKVKLGFDNFSIRDLKWKAPRLLEHAASLQVDTILFSDLGVFESREEKYLRGLKQKADEIGVEIQVGTGSVCPTSKAFNAKAGTAEAQLLELIQIAKILGSKVARCYLGTGNDRQGDGGIYPHIENMVKVCKSVRNAALEAQVKIGIENHAGDMQAWELAELVEAAGKDYVGVTLDSGNAAWTIEDPMLNLEILGPYTVTTGVRDSCIWETEKGANVEWVNMGEGVIDWKAYLARFKQLCPGVPFVLEVITHTWTRNLDYLLDDFWKAYPKARASEFAKFIRLAKHGKPYQPPADRPAGEKSEALTQKQQLYDLDRSLKYCKETLGLGMK